MDEYALTRLIADVGKVNTRKCLQKAIFLLQEAGHDLDAKYVLHLYGPYSQDVADAAEKLTQLDILDEEVHPNALGRSYSYSLGTLGRRLLDEYEKTKEGKAHKVKVAEYEDTFKKLCKVGPWELELAATIAFYHGYRRLDWAKATEKTAEFKRVEKDADILKGAEKIARKYSIRAA